MEGTKKLNTLDKILLIVAIFDAIFVISMIILFCVFQGVPDTLIVAVMGATFGECGCCSYIWKNKQLRKGDRSDADKSGDTSSCDINLGDCISVRDTVDKIEG